MLTLLRNIQGSLQDLTGYFSKRSINLVPDMNIVPVQATFPCINLKDGRITNSNGMGGTRESTYIVEIGLYQRSKKQESLIEGDAVGSGIIELTRIIHMILDGDLSIDSRLISVNCLSEDPSQYFAKGDMHAQRKILYYSFELQEMRPCTYVDQKEILKNGGKL